MLVGRGRAAARRRGAAAAGRWRASASVIYRAAGPDRVRAGPSTLEELLRSEFPGLEDERQAPDGPDSRCDGGRVWSARTRWTCARAPGSRSRCGAPARADAHERGRRVAGRSGRRHRGDRRAIVLWRWDGCTTRWGGREHRGDLAGGPARRVAGRGIPATRAPTWRRCIRGAMAGEGHGLSPATSSWRRPAGSGAGGSSSCATARGATFELNRPVAVHDIEADEGLSAEPLHRSRAWRAMKPRARAHAPGACAYPATLQRTRSQVDGRRPVR